MAHFFQMSGTCQLFDHSTDSLSGSGSCMVCPGVVKKR